MPSTGLEFSAAKIPYGTLSYSSSLSRGAAAAILARVIDPGQRLTLTLKSFDLCRDVFFLEREDTVLTIDGTVVTAEQFAPILADAMYEYDHRHMPFVDSRISDCLETAVNQAKEEIALRQLAEEAGITWSREDLTFGGNYGDGYRGRSVEGQLFWETSWYLRIKGLKAPYQDKYGESEKREDGSIYAPWFDHLYADIEAQAASFTVIQEDILETMDIDAAFRRLIQLPTYRHQDF